MEHFGKKRLFVIGVYCLLGLLIVYFLFIMHPLLGYVYDGLKAVFAPFFIAMIIAYVLHPVVTLLTKRKVPRTIAVLIIYAVFITLVTVVLVNIIPLMVKQLSELSSQMPHINAKAQQVIDGLSKALPSSIQLGLNDSISVLEKRIGETISNFTKNIGSVLNMLFVALIIPFLIFYILKDFDVFERAIIAYVPRNHRKHTVMMCRDIDTALGSYIRGQFLVCVIIGVLVYVGYWMIGVPYALLLALCVAVFNIIPYLGPYFGAAPALLCAATVSLKMMAFVIVINMICQIVEGNIISPQVVGKTLHMHPLSIIFALLVGGKFAGMVGLILAVPVFAVMKVILQHLVSYQIQRRTL